MLNIKREYVVQSPLVIVDLLVAQKLSTITRYSTITRQKHAKIDNWSHSSIHYIKRFHYYEIHYYECRMYLKITRTLAILLEHMHNKFEINLTKIKGNCQSGRNVVTHDSKSDLHLVVTNIPLISPSKIRTFPNLKSSNCFSSLANRFVAISS